MTVRVVVVGGGIAGLASAHELADREGVSVTVLEAGARLGGKVHTDSFVGVALDTGPDAFLARRPEAVQLCRELGLAERLVAPASTSASVWTRGKLRRLPEGLLLGVPTAIGPLARSGVLSPLGAIRAAVEPLLPGRPLDGDAAIGAVVRRRLGAEAADRLVDPLIGGINAGDTDRLSIDAVVPQLAAAARRSPSLVRGARAARAAGAPAGTPVFLTLPDGLSDLVGALAVRLATAGVEVRTACPVTAIERHGRAYRLHTSAGEIEADAVVLALPADTAARLLVPLAPAPAATLAAIEHATVALVALAWPAADLPGPLDGSGFLVPRPEGRLMTACSWASSKWAHLAGNGQVLFRVSAGRAGDGRAAAMDDDELVARLVTELQLALGLGTGPTASRVTRWPNGFPQYMPGHLDRMVLVGRQLDDQVPGLALAGAALGGVGLPACIGSGRLAAAHVVALASTAMVA